MKRLSLAILGVVVLSGCACLMRMGVNSMSGTFKKFGENTRKQQDAELARLAFPSNLLMLDGMLDVSPENEDLLGVACEAYCGYAMMFAEDEDPEEASKLYIKGRDYGLRALKAQNSKFRKALDKGMKFTEAVQYLRKKDVPQVFWTGNCWASWLNLNKKIPESLFDLPSIKALMDRVNELDETYFYGGVHLFYLSYYAGLPAFAGGGAEKAEAAYNRAMEISQGKLLLIRLFHALYYATLIKDEDLFVKELNTIIETPPDLLPEQGLANAVAKRKAKRLLKDKDRYF